MSEPSFRDSPKPKLKPTLISVFRKTCLVQTGRLQQEVKQRRQYQRMMKRILDYTATPQPKLKSGTFLSDSNVGKRTFLEQQQSISTLEPSITPGSVRKFMSQTHFGKASPSSLVVRYRASPPSIVKSHKPSALSHLKGAISFRSLTSESRPIFSDSSQTALSDPCWDVAKFLSTPIVIRRIDSAPENSPRYHSSSLIKGHLKSASSVSMFSLIGVRSRRRVPKAFVAESLLLLKSGGGLNCYVTPRLDARDQGIQANMGTKLSFAEIFASKRRVINRNHFQYENVKRCITSGLKLKKPQVVIGCINKGVGNVVNVQSQSPMLGKNAFPPIILNSKRI